MTWQTIPQMVLTTAERVGGGEGGVGGGQGGWVAEQPGRGGRGGNWLTGTLQAAGLGDRLGVTVGVRAVFEHPSVAALARMLTTASG
ncbi:hypothetical protein, partial [Nocardia abscessus]|uniref:hypothetical protein n=1 Tax=Nocardia abscessus TaxID=120957 RepID=UPI002456E9F5